MLAIGALIDARTTAGSPSPGPRQPTVYSCGGYQARTSFNAKLGVHLAIGVTHLWQFGETEGLSV